jgi:predicted AlkP superfamily phosphohydrolase/phosphomutase
MSNTVPLVIFGLDGGDPDLLLQWAQQGYMSTLASILQRGWWAKTGGPDLITEHGPWPYLFSGVSRGRLGYYYLRQLKPGTYDLHLMTGRGLDAQPFWAGLRGQDRKVAIFDVPEVYPVAGLRGVQLTNWSAHQGWVSADPADGPQAEPPELLDEVRRIFGARLNILENSDSDFDEDRRIYHRLLEQLSRSGELYREFVSRDRFDVIVIVFGASHTGGHQFWKYRHEVGAEHELTHAVRDIYAAIDREMGLLLAHGLADANVIVVSSVGMKDQYPMGGLTEAFCRQLGYQVSPPFSPSLMGYARRLVPERWRVAVSRHFSRETRERLLADQFRGGTDWSKTTAFAIPSSHNGFLRVNLRGREPQGIVQPGAEYEDVLRRLENDLQQLTDPDTGEPVVQQVERTRDLFGDDAHAALPDLFAIWKPLARFRSRVVHPAGEIVQPRPEWCRGSDHLQNGFVAAAGPGMRARGRVEDVPLMDLAPSFLALLDEPAPQTMRGRVRRELFLPPRSDA